MRINNRDSWLLSQDGAVMEDGCLEVSMPLLSALEWDTNGRLHGGAHWTRGIGVVLLGTCQANDTYSDDQSFKVQAKSSL